MFLSAYLMKRCRIPAGLMIFFVVPLGLLLQGQALMFILPEMIGMTVLLQSLAALLAGYQRTSMALLAVGMSLDSRLVLPLLPIILLCLMRTMGCRRAFLWMLMSVCGFLVISGEFLLNNPASYLSRIFALSSWNHWNPIICIVHVIEQEFKLNLITRSVLDSFIESSIPRIILNSLIILTLMNFRWLKGDGGILGLIAKFMKASRGLGIRPSPWTPRQTLTVIFESILISSLLRFPSLIHQEEFEVLTVLVSGFFCIALAEPVPLPALFGIFTALAFPMSFLYRELESELESELLKNSKIVFNPKLRESLHFLPMLLLPVVQLVIMILFTRKDIAMQVSGKMPPNLSNVTFAGHRRSSSLSRRISK